MTDLSLLQRVAASPVTVYGTLAVGGLVGIAGVSLRIEWSATFDSAWNVLLFTLAIPVGGFVGMLVAGTMGVVALAPLFQAAARRNGAPFVVGDRVEILARRRRGEIVEVYELWPDRRQLRVRLGEAAKNSGEDIYFETDVRRVPGAVGPGDPPRGTDG